MKKRIAALMLLLTMLTGCVSVPQFRELRIYASFYPFYAVCGKLLRGIDGIALHCLVQPQDGCLRNYELSDWDFSILSAADAVVIGGRGLESFESTLYAMGDEGPAVLTAMQGLYLYGQSHAEAPAEDASHLAGANPHLYLSFAGAEKITDQLSEALTELLPSQGERIGQNRMAYLREIAAAKAEWENALAGFSGEKAALLCEGAVYPALEFGLQAAYQMDREPGTTLFPAAVDDLLAELKDGGIGIVLLEQQAPYELADALTDAGYSTVKIDTLSSYPQDAGFDGYLSALQKNARLLLEALQNQKKR